MVGTFLRFLDILELKQLLTNEIVAKVWEKERKYFSIKQLGLF